ncbi:vitrin-like [Megalops cyprinoides]|uniref:vitrin-like n=1 Tax=Megalops cyprinoides TaxID=118141 RepID=UPI001863EAF0|nr:vitrin-like [Megalops cyprinoides]
MGGTDTEESACVPLQLRAFRRSARVLLLVRDGETQHHKKPKQVVPPIDCDVRAGKINLPEFIAKCPANCRETKQPVYGSRVFASISSICNAAIHSGIITNAGGRVIVSKTAGQSSYKGSYSHGVRSLSLPKWRESFIVSVGKPKKGVLYPSTLDYTPTRPPFKMDHRETGAPWATTIRPTTAAPLPTTTTPEPTTTTPELTTTVSRSTTFPPPTANPHAAVYKVRDAGSSHPYFASIEAAGNLTIRGSSVYEGQFSSHGISDMHRQNPVSALRRHSGPPSVPVFDRVQSAAPERSQEAALSNPSFMRRDWPPPPFFHPDWYAGPRQSTDVGRALPDSGYTWSTAERSETAERNPRPDISEYERWYYNFAQYPYRSGEPDSSRKVLPESAHTRFKPIDAWTPGGSQLDSGFTIREQDSLPEIPEPVSQGDPSCKVDIAFLMDGSWSIGRRRFQIQKDFLVEMSQVIDVGVAGPMMGIVQYGDDPVTEFSLKAYPNPKDLKTAINNIMQKGGLSNVGKALSYINKHYFTDGNGNRGGAPNVAVVLVDGWPTDRVEEASRLVRESGINVFFVTIEGPDEKEKQNVVEANFVDKAVCRTNGFFSLPVPSWFDLRVAVRPLVKRVCDADRLVCSKTCLNSNDIGFVIDGSSSVGTGNFRTVLQFVANITREFEISDTDTRVGAVQYTYEQRVEFALGQHNSKAELLAAIQAVDYWSGGTSTGAAIAYANDKLFSQSKPNKRKIMIVITDGRSYDDVSIPAMAIHRSGVIAYTVGIAWAVKEELEDIATDPDKEHSFFVEEFDHLHKFVPKIIHNICQEYNSQPRN